MTRMNDASSRSHAVFIIIVENSKLEAGGCCHLACLLIVYPYPHTCTALAPVGRFVSF